MTRVDNRGGNIPGSVGNGRIDCRIEGVEMTVIFTGISCSGRKELMHDFQQLCAERGMDVGFFNVGDFMKQAALDAGIEFTEKVLDSDRPVLALARRAALYEIARLAQEHTHALIGIHVCFRWRGVLVEGYSYREMLQFPADMFINVVDNLQDIAHRMEGNPQWSGMQRDEINVWLDEEEFLTKQLAGLCNKPYYVVSRHLNLENLYDLLFTPSKKKFYLSYPITLLQDSPERIQEIRDFGASLAKDFIVFDPLDIKDMELAKRLEVVETPATLNELDRVTIDRIKTRTISRDYQFIRQSDFVVVLYLTDKLSPGVLSEMNFASRYNKPVYAVYSHKRSPFFENLCEKIFDTPEELRNFLRETYC